MASSMEVRLFGVCWVQACLKVSTLHLCCGKLFPTLETVSSGSPAAILAASLKQLDSLGFAWWRTEVFKRGLCFRF